MPYEALRETTFQEVFPIPNPLWFRAAVNALALMVSHAWPMGPNNILAKVLITLVSKRISCILPKGA